jgi:CrcB protein
MPVLQQYLAVAIGGSLGAVARHLVASLSGRYLTNAFPLGTFIVNVTGSLLLGWFLTVVHERVPVSDAFRLAVATGFVGAYTTFSTFAYETNLQLRLNLAGGALCNMVGSLVLGLLAVRLGIWLGGR